MSDDQQGHPIPPPDGPTRKIGPYEQSLRDQSQRIARAVARRAARRRRYRVLAALVAVAVIAAVAFGAMRLFGRSDNAPVASSTSAVPTHCANPSTVTVAVPAAMQPALKEVAAALADKEDGPCTTFSLQSAEAGIVSRTLATAARPHGWITDSSLWVDQANAAGNKLTAAEPFASTAIVVAMPADRAQSLGDAPTWADLLGAEGGITFPDPNTSTVGAYGLAALSTSVPSDRFTPTVTASATSPATTTDPGALAGSATSKAVPVPEAALVDFNATNAAQPLAAVAPSEGAAPLEYSLVTTTEDSAATKSLQAFGAYLTSEQARSILTKHGFRVPRGPEPAAPEKLVGTVKDAEAPSAETVANIRQVWSKAAPQRQVLIVLDVSGSMLGRTDKGIKLALAQNGVRTALAALPETARVAFWVFSNHIGAQGDDFKSLAAFAPMSDAGQRASLERSIAGLDKVVGGGSGLYDSIYNAYQNASSAYQPGRTNTVVLIVDGPNEDDYGLTLDQLRQKLATDKNAARPVQLVIVGIGDAPDANALTPLTKLVGGRYVAVSRPEDIESAIVGAVTAP